MIKVGQVTANSDDWQTLIRDSHQTSLYVLPEWVALHPVKLSRGLTPPTMIPYQGMLCLWRDDRDVAQALIERIEQLPHPVSVWNPPALVDIRPFTWRFWDAQQIWQHEIKYTFICDKDSRMERRAEYKVTGYEVKEITDLDWYRRWEDLPWVTAEDCAIMEQILKMPCTKVYGDPDGTVVWCVDNQDRGYYVASIGQVTNVLATLIKRHRSSDLVGCNSPERSLFKRGFGGHLRTYYGMKLL
jgi:hypothetical protein